MILVLLLVVALLFAIASLVPHLPAQVLLTVSVILVILGLLSTHL